ncbi:hypothetical protein CTI14_67935, partial [Methylobacterium radiotolerans]
SLANAIYNATGIRVRDYPMTLDKMLRGFEEQEGQTQGLGELGIWRRGASLANAIYNATGIRVRDYPMTLDKMLRGFEEQEG